MIPEEENHKDTKNTKIRNYLCVLCVFVVYSTFMVTYLFEYFGARLAVYVYGKQVGPGAPGITALWKRQSPDG
jgi:hypothetical protein